MKKSKNQILNSIASDLEFLKEYLKRTLQDENQHTICTDIITKISSEVVQLTELPEEKENKGLIHFQEFQFNSISRELLTEKRSYKLTEKEFDILYPLCQNPNKVVDIGKRSSSTNTHLSNLKKKIPELRDVLQSRHGQGLFLSVTIKGNDINN